MGFGYRKSFKAGPFRLTASKTGISYSAGVKGATITRRANGRVQTTLSVPGTGLRYTTTGGAKKPKARPQAARQAPARNAAALPGTRASVLPAPPPSGTRPPQIQGIPCYGHLAPGEVQIDRTRLGKINGNASAVIAWHQLVAVDFLDPTIAVNGHVHFATGGDPRGLTATGNGNRMAAAARNPHAVLFTWQQRSTYRQLRDLLAANPATQMPAQALRQSHRRDTVAAPGVAEEISKLYALYEQGALTSEQFEQAKAQVLRQPNQ